LGLDDRLGAVSEGKQAELVLLRGNPLDDIRRTAELEAVYRAGRLINAAQLDSMRAAACDTLNEGAR
jgi:imidazolonepropionase-like amidohydrolase